MSVPVRICIYDALTEGEVAAAFGELAGVTVAGVSKTWEDLQNHLSFGSIDIAGVVLDDPEGGLNLTLISRIVELSPKCAVIGISQTSDPQAIIGAMRAGCAQFVRRPIEPRDLQDAVERIRQTRVPVATQSKRIMVVGSAGGAGATTLACNLAVELALITSLKCALVDLGLEFGDVAFSFDAQPKYSLADVAQGTTDVDRVMLERAMVELNCNVSVLARPERIEDSMNVTPEGVEKTFRMLGQLFPFVVADVPRSCHVLTPATVHETDKILIVSQMSVPFIRNTTRVYEYFLESGIPQDRIEIVLNRTQSVLDKITPEEVEAHFKRPVFAMIPNDYRRLATSRDLGQPISADSAKSPARRAIQQIAQKIAGGTTSPASNGSGNGNSNGGLLGMLWGRKTKSGVAK